MKLDGYRVVAIKTGRTVQLRSRNNKDFSARFPLIVMALTELPSEKVIDGELVAFDESGRPSFNALQNYASAHRIYYYVFDLLILEGRDLRARPLTARRELLRSDVLPRLSDPIRYSPTLDGKLSDLIDSVRQQKLEGLIAKRTDSAYESGDRSGAWLKMRINRGQECVIGGYTVGGATFAAQVLGYYENGELLYASRTRNGFTPAIRRELLKQMKPLEIADCPFANLPERVSGRWERGTNGDEDEGVPVAHAQAGRAVRVRRMDRRWSSAAYTVCRTQRRQEGSVAKGGTGLLR